MKKINIENFQKSTAIKCLMAKQNDKSTNGNEGQLAADDDGIVENINEYFVVLFGCRAA